MRNLLKFSGIVTKVRAMQSHLLTQQDFEEIANLRNVSEVVSYLKKTISYKNIFENVNENTLHRGDIEKILTKSLYNDYSKLYLFSGMDIRKFLKLYMKRYEVDLINYCSLIIFNHYEEPFDLNHKKAFFDKYSQISINKLLASHTMEDLIEALNGTEYYTPLKNLQNAKNPTLFDYELTLDLYYFSAIWKEKKKILKKKDLEIFTRDSGLKIDLLNLQWIYRAKKHYQMSPADIYSLIIPIHYHLNAEILKKLIETESPDEFLACISQTYYGRNYSFDSSHTIEKLYKDCLSHLYIVEKRRSPYSISAINTYLFLKEEEIKKLTTTLECIRYGLSPQETLEYVGGVIKA